MSKEKIKKADIIQHIKDNYSNLEQSIVSQLLLETPNHHSTTGSYREEIWSSFFRQIIPQKFSIAQGVFIIDSCNDTLISKEVDLAIFDEQYTPYIFNYGKIKFIPIEAVAIVVQCKSENVTGTKNAKTLQEWVDSITCLQTNSNSIARLATNIATESPHTQKQTSPIKILCAQKNCTEKDGEPKHGFDIAIYPQKNKISKNDLEKCKPKYNLKISFSNRIDDLYKAYHVFNQPKENYIAFDDFKKVREDKIKDEICKQKKGQLEKDLNCHTSLSMKKVEDFKVHGNQILSLIFQLNQLLMLINNPMLFPHQAYARMFNETSK